MKYLFYFSLFIFSFSQSYARDPGTGSNTTVGPGPATPDAGNKDTSVMGGGTPGNMGEDTLDIDEPQQREESRQKREKTIKRENVTDQNSERDSL